MKKIIFILILFFIFTIDIYAASKFSLGEKVPNMHIESVSENDLHNGIPFILRRDDGDFVYCLNPFQQLNTIDYYTEYSYNATKFNITKEQLNKMNLIAYYGYNYTGHTDLKWYGVTQFLIWKTLDLKDIYFTDEKDGNKIIAYEEEIEKVETLVQNYGILPSFANKSYEYSINSSNELIDSKTVLSNYEIQESNIDAKISGNKLIINTKKEGTYKIKFIKKSPINRAYKLYYLAGSQSLLYPGKIEDITFELTIKVSSGSLTISEKDRQNKKRSFATLEGAVYGFYDDDVKLISKLTTDKNGVIEIKNLPFGVYYVRQLTPSVGYKEDPKTYEITITKYNKVISLKSFVDVIKGNIIINKYYGEESKYELENDATFEIYDINDNLVGEYKTEDGVISVELEYGDYYIVQKSGKEGYKYAEKQYVSIREEKDYSLDLYSNIIKGNVIINKYYGEESKYELENAATFEIYDINDNLVGEYKTEDGVINIELPYGDYYLLQIEGINGYRFVDKIDISIKQEKDYSLNLYSEKELIVVEVPDTLKYNYNKFISIFLILAGSILIVISKIKRKV
ncbi:MAG: Cys-Gln thioester bond-forming surface protein [Bacilli bacterium]|nr:Cys-Gln thioester bond-forming surface protein [Bacilli bacterium]